MELSKEQMEKVIYELESNYNSKIFDDEKVQTILSKCLDQNKLESMSVLDFQELFAVQANSF